jgi:2-dehydro-3-deoxyphosphogluconate aldolase/(4S)-4-hydroxy-2-oxoglutarate aldolase
MSGAIERIEAERLLAILRPAGPEAAVEMLAGIAAAGIGAAEVSLSRPDGLDSLRAGIAAYGECLVLGAGTVRGVEGAAAAIEAGARFLVSPGLDLEVQAHAAAAGVPHIPGVFTPTDVETALAAGVPLLKLFPAGRVGPAYVEDLLAPFPDARLVAVGGVGTENAAAFLAAGAVAVGLGSALTQSGAEATSVAVAARAEAARDAILTTTKETHAH